MSKIGIFDSGLGGISVLTSLQKRYPKQDFVFLADQKNVPYGNKTKEELIKIVNSNFTWFHDHGVDQILIACNTASSLNLNFDKSTQEIIEPTCAQAQGKGYKSILVVATDLCIHLGKYQRVLNQLCPDALIHAVPLPWLAQAIENLESPESIKQHLDHDLKDYLNVDCIILGCTHYPLVKTQFEELFNKPIIDSNEILLQNTTDGKGEVEYFTTADPKVFEEKMLKLFQKDINANYTEKTN